MPTEIHSRYRRSLRARAIALSVSLLAGFALLEGIARVRQYVKYGSAKNELYETVVDSGSGLVIDSRGFRNPELQFPKPPGMVRLAFIGASTTFCAEASSNEATWPHLVWQQLQTAWPEVRFDYVNASMPGYVVSSSLRNLERRVKPLQPDVIIIYEAINDLSRDSRELARKQGIERGSVDDSSGLGRWLLTWSLLEKNIRLAARQRHANTDGARQLNFDPENLSAGFHVRLRDLAQKARQAAPVVAIATFSQKVRRDQSSEQQLRNANTHLYYMPHLSVESILRGVEEYNRVIRAVSSETNATLIDGEDSIPGDDRHFNDSVHFKDAGCRMMARRVLDSLNRSKALKNLLDNRKTESAVR
jgi:lysophospholipase L1-like esterase